MNSEASRSFPWTYDQLQRYAVLRMMVEAFTSGPNGLIGEPGRGGKDVPDKDVRARPLRVLDVGGAAADRTGAGFWLPAVEILSDLNADVTVADVSDCRLPRFIMASGTDLPFATGSFDIVSAFDVLEHIPKDHRAAFVAEIGRIASRAVLLSCPTKSPGVEQAEALLNAEIKRLYGVEHGMLAEHRDFGLPLEEDVAAALSSAGLAAVSFGYGALSTWLTYQVFRSSFLVRAGAPRATEAIDLYWAGQPQAAELSSPFYRRFWIASKTRGEEFLAVRETAMKERLKKNGLKPIVERTINSGRKRVETASAPKGPAAAPIDEFSGVERVTREVLSRPFVSAIVATSGEPALLGPCLDMILTQVVDFDLEVAVWNFNRRADTAAWLDAHYPQVRICEGDFPAVSAGLRGDYIFLVDEKLNPASDAVSRYVGLIQPETADTVLAVSAPWRGGFPTTWTGMAASAWKKSKGLGVKAGIVGDTSRIQEDWEIVPKFKGWVIGDALFFRRIAVHSRKIAAAPDRNSIFLWEYK